MIAYQSFWRASASHPPPARDKFALKAQIHFSRGQRPWISSIEAYAPCKGAPKMNGQIVRFWIALSGQNNLWAVLPRALPSAKMVQAVGLEHSHDSYIVNCRTVTPCPSMIFFVLRPNLSTFPALKTQNIKCKITQCSRASRDHRLQCPGSLKKVNGHQKISQFFSGTLMENHWQIRRKPSKKPCEISQKNRCFCRIISALNFGPPITD
jgi:hypothetical protein